MTRETEALLQQVLIEQLHRLRREREGRARERHDYELDEIDRKRWGYPPLRSRRWGRR